MDSLNNLIATIVASIVDDTGSVEVSSSEEDSTLMYEVKVSKEDTGKLIGKQGRVATAMRTIVKAAGAKLGMRVQINVSKEPVGFQKPEEPAPAVEG